MSAVAPPVLSVRGLEKRFGGTVVLSDCAIDIAEGEIVTLLGPSGCGKTTLLRCIAGFWTPDAGAITIDGRDALALPVNRRPVGVVFQSYALFPHMTVAQNVGYGLRMRGVPRAEIAQAVARALETVALSAFADRWPAQLSGGQQQRVAVARVLVLEPRVLLLDEPFSALDAKLRGAMQMDLRQLIKRLGITAIFVTHDQEEALVMSDRIAVMRQGRIEQIAPPEVVFDHPATAYVADFVGASNFWPAEAGGGQVVLPDGSVVGTALSGPVRAMARPHNIRLEPGTAGPWTGTVVQYRPVGPLVDYVVQTNAGPQVRVSALRQDGARTLVEGAAVTLHLRDPALCAIYPAE
ncbi:MAG: ABC transporter ATP-binding protein [Rhodobacteraceae bacterium]|nr:ABC transporter ATP-binding protein [Paracoccaceae bacterium]